jgi:hypothetical protein
MSEDERLLTTNVTPAIIPLIGISGASIRR